MQADWFWLKISMNVLEKLWGAVIVLSNPPVKELAGAVSLDSKEISKANFQILTMLQACTEADFFAGKIGR